MYGGNLKTFTNIYTNPSFMQKGYNIRPYIIQGNGLNSVFRNVYTFLKPLLLKSLKEVGSEIVRSGNELLNTQNDESFSENIKTQAKKSISNLSNKLSKKMSGTGVKRGIKRNINNDLISHLDKRPFELRALKNTRAKGKRKKKKKVKITVTKRKIKKKRKNIKKEAEDLLFS